VGLESYRRKVSESKRRSIMHAARAEFQDNGFTHAAMAEIARKADVSTATLYKHFGSKEELFAAVVEESYSNIGIGQEPADESKTAKDALKTATEDYLNVQFGSGLNDLMRAVISESAGDPKVGREFLERGYNRRAQDLRTFIDRLVARKLLKQHDTEMSASQVAGMIKEKFIWPAMFDPEFKLPSDKDKIISDALDTFLARYGA
jgi:TetR/AcrR family transcriptional regulator, regulator of autoinduction and epiphytic fitness